MSTQVVPGMLVTTADTKEAVHQAARRMADIIRNAQSARGKAFIAISGGNTPRDAYTELATSTDVDWNAVEVFWVDERAVPPTDDDSNFKWAKATLLDGAKIPDVRVHRMHGEAPDLDAEAVRYGKELERVPQDKGVPVFDLLLMGIGDDGHTASLFPGMTMVDIRDKWVTAVPKSEHYSARISLTSPVIEAGRTVVALVAGAKKKEPLEKVWSVTGSTRDTPARILRNVHGTLVWVIDRAAGGLV
jgi:6-phosphogluconolactonase